MADEKTVFLDVELSKKQKEEVTALANDPERLNNMLETCAQDDVRVTLTLDKGNDCYVAFLSPVSNSHSYRGYMVSARSGSGLKAVAGAAYRHCIVYDRKWPIGAAKAKRPTDD